MSAMETILDDFHNCQQSQRRGIIMDIVKDLGGRVTEDLEEDGLSMHQMVIGEDVVDQDGS